MMSGVFDSGPFQRELMRSLDTFHRYFPIPECIVEIHILSNWQNPNIVSLIGILRVILKRKPKKWLVETPRTTTIIKRVNQSNLTFLKKLQRLIQPSENWKNWRLWFLYHHSTYLFGLCRREMVIKMILIYY